MPSSLSGTAYQIFELKCEAKLKQTTTNGTSKTSDSRQKKKRNTKKNK